MEARVQSLQKAMLGKGEAAFVLSPAGCRYLTGFDAEDCAVLITEKSAYFLTDDRYIEAANETVQGLKPISCNGLFSTLFDLLKAEKIERLYLEQSLSLSAFSRLKAGCPATLVPDDTLDYHLSSMRQVKDEKELSLLREAQRLTEKGFEHILPFLTTGISERDAALELEFFMRRQGADGVSFDFIVISGKNTSRPHGVPTDKVIEPGDFVTMDFGALYRGYHADMTRTVAIGEVTDEMKRVYDTVLSAQQTALSVLRAGISGKVGDEAARRVIEKAGYGDYFGHGTGHGVGLEIHEAPRLSPRASDDPLPVGAVVTVEPGIYLPGRFGVRIEDMVVLTENGCENLTRTPKELLIL
ncbi:MAG: aminopeptidase P family protein [Clostridia bacterium]|nr:aminopeptidase P family protein [Clostridia bacterium]